MRALALVPRLNRLTCPGIFPPAVTRVRPKEGLADFSNKVLSIDLSGFYYAAAQHRLVK